MRQAGADAGSWGERLAVVVVVREAAVPPAGVVVAVAGVLAVVAADLVVAELVLAVGETDLVPIARALHRRVLGADRPFVVCDPRRRDGADYESVRSPVNYGTGVAAFDAAVGGSLCVLTRRLPRDFSSVVTQIRATNEVQLIVCADGRFDAHLALPIPIRVPSLRVRTDELPRIVDEYAIDGIAELGVLRGDFTATARQWVLQNAPGRWQRSKRPRCGWSRSARRAT